jgi:predicted outer membrane protein
MMSRKMWASAVWGIAAIVVSGAALAQQQQQPATGQAKPDAGVRRAQPGEAGQDAGRVRGRAGHRGAVAGLAAKGLDQNIVHCLTQGNQAEIAFAKIAQEKSQDPEVKKFAQQMISDHTKFINKLQEFSAGERTTVGQRAGETTITARRQVSGEQNPSQADTAQPPAGQQRTQPGKVARGAAGQQTPGQADTAQERGQRGRGFARGGAMVGHHPFLNVLDEVAQQCQQSMTRELNSKQGAEFDRCYIGSQVMAHMKMVDALTVFEKHASPELQQVLQEGLQTTKQHLSEAKQIADRLMGQSGKAADRQGGTSRTQ